MNDRGRWAARAAAAAALVFALFPVYWIVLTALRPRGEIFSHPVRLLPGALTLDNLRTVWFGSGTSQPVLPFLGTSLIVAGISTLLATGLGTLCAYAMARHRAGGRAFAMWILSQRFLPGIALIVPLFVLFRKFALFDTYTGLILLYTTVHLPLAVWLLLGFVQGLPAELEEAALVDGAGHFGAFVRIALPLLRPGIAVTLMFVFLFSWNEFLFAYQLAGDDVATVTVYLPRLRSAIAELYGEIAAASLLSVLPALGFAWVLQRSLVQGLTLGGGKEL
jgi:ABC-type glycerol-3-phosphate transport system permease component